MQRLLRTIVLVAVAALIPTVTVASSAAAAEKPQDAVPWGLIVGGFGEFAAGLPKFVHGDWDRLLRWLALKSRFTRGRLRGDPDDVKQRHRA